MISSPRVGDEIDNADDPTNAMLTIHSKNLLDIRFIGYLIIF